MSSWRLKKYLFGITSGRDVIYVVLQVLDYPPPDPSQPFGPMPEKFLILFFNILTIHHQILHSDLGLCTVRKF